MNKQQLLKEIFKLSREDIFDLEEILHGYKNRCNNNERDTLVSRCMFQAGYKSLKELCSKYKNDRFLIEIYRGNAVIDARNYMRLKEILNIDNDTFVEIIKECAISPRKERKK